MIGGQDILFRTETSPQVTEGAVRIVRALWPEAIVENADTGEPLQNASYEIQELPSELFIYRDSTARESWIDRGACPDNSNQMVHIIRGQDSVTIVVDDPEAEEMSKLINTIHDHVFQDIFWIRADAA